MEPRLLVLMALATVAIAGPITVQESTNCATECTPTTKLNYSPGTTYIYDYRVDTTTSMAGASEDSAKLTLTATAELEVFGPCEMALSLKNTRLYHTDSTGRLVAAQSMDSFRRSLETSALRFASQNGAIEHICISGQRDEPWVMNIKKGALSAFQNSMDDLSHAQNLTETDVAGTCETQYKVTNNGYYSNAVNKVKDILTCTERHDYNTMLQMVPYNVPSELQNLPVMKTTHQCDQVIEKGGVLQSSTCRESHIYRPFSNGQSGGATFITQTLTYKTYKQSVSSRLDAITSREGLVFDHSATRPTAEQARHQTEQKLKEICETTAYDVRPESPRLFSELVSALKALEKQTMEEILLKLKTKSLCPNNDKAYKSYLDALPMAGTSASVGLLTSLILDDDITGLQAKASIASLAFIKVPTSEMLLDAKRLVDSEKHRDDALLPVSSMVNNFCSTSSACAQSYTVLSIMASLERNIGSSCDASGKNFDQILLSLRAIGNAGHTTRAVPLINRCLTSASNPLEIRVAAAEAFRRMPCVAETTDLWNTYENADLDSELRISAYRALMRCPTEETLAKVAASLEGDLDENVGAFVYSHLTNLRETSDPHKQDVARALDNLVISNKFESNPMKASTHLEASALINKINTGFVAESNLVWSNNAQLPRSASANLTVELFGQSINLVDFGGRLEGLESLIKTLFGPRMRPQDRKDFEDIRGSFFTRFFGNEMIFLHSQKLNSPMDKVSSKWLDMLITLAEGRDIELTQSDQFLDVRMTIPTVAGLPIFVDINGSAVVDLVLKGKADLLHLSASPRSTDIQGEIRPSGALEVTGTMTVDAFVTKTGLRMRNTLHSSTSLKGNIKMDRGEVLSVELDTPKEKIEVFDASSKFFILHNNQEQEQRMITENRKQFELCSSDKLADITGVVLCGQVSYPNASLQVEGPYFPLTGPSSASLTLRKVDTHSGYKLLAKKVENKRSKMAQISFNTPGSTVNRLILIDLSLDMASKKVDAQVNTPWKRASLNGALVDRSNLKSLTGSLTVDDSDVYALTSEVKISKSKKKLHLSPMIEIKKPGMKDVQLSGYVSVEAPKSLDLEFSLSGLQKQPYQIKTSLINKKKERGLTASFSNDGGQRQYSIEALTKLNIMGKKTTIINTSSSLKVNTPKKEIVSMVTKADYKEDKSLKVSGIVDIHKVMRKPASIKLSVIKNAKKRGANYDIDANIKSTMITGRVDSSFFVKNSGFLSTKITVDYTIPKVAKNKILLSGKLNDRSTKAYTKYTLKGNLDVKKNPEYNLGVTFDLDHKKKHSETELEIKYGPNPKDKTKRFYLNTMLNRKIPNYKNAVVKYKIKALAPEHNVNIFLNGQHEHNPKTIDSAVELSYGKNKDLKASIFLKNKSDKTAKMNGRASLSWPGSDYVLLSKLDQKNARFFTHEISLKENNAVKHSVETTLKMPDADSRVIKSVLDLQGLKKITVSGSTDFSRKAPHASAEVQYGDDKYGLSTKAKSKGKGGVLITELIHPDRRILVKLNGDKTKTSCDGSIEASWDADKDKSKKITLGGSVFNKSSRKTLSLGGDLSFTSPFDNFENLAGMFKYGSDDAQHDAIGKFSWGGKHKQVMSSLSLKRPINLSHLEGTFEAKTPFKKMRSVSADISHSWENALKTVLKGNVNKENAKLVIEGEGDLNDLKGSMSLSSTIKNAEEISGSVNHKYGSGKLESDVVINHNGKPYGYDLIMEHSKYGWDIKSKGDLILTTPKTKISNTWDHENGKNNVKSTFTSQWGKKKINVDLTGSHELSSHRNINGEFKIDTPWKPMRDVVVSLNHKHGHGVVKSKASLVQNGKTKAFSNVKYSKTNDGTDLDFTLTSPYHEDLSGKANAKYGSYPMTSSVEMQWHPKKKVTMETSLNAENWDNSAFDVQLTTPVKGYRKASLRAANRKEGDEMISQLNLDYGVRKSIDLEARNKLEGRNKMVRVKLTTPFETMKSLDTGLRFDGEATNFDSSADFEIVPLVGKFQGSAKWMHNSDNGDLSSTIRLDTPYPEYPYFELSASSQDRGTVRKSLIEARLHPRQVYSLDSSYSFKLPISFEATLNSPYPEYDNLGLVLQHNHSPSNVASHGELRYQADKKIEADLNGDWSSNIEGNLMVKTPFSGYESNKVALRHQGDSDAFTSHGEIHVAEKSVVADASFKSGYTSTGAFTLSTPLPTLSYVDLSIKKRGRAKNFKGDVTLKINDDKFDVDYNQKLTKELIKSTFKLATTLTEPLKLSFEHKGTPQQFTNEISANYGRKYDIDTVVAFDYSHPDVTGHGTIKYKLGGRRNTARANFNKNGALNDMSFRGVSALNDDEISVSGSWKSINGLNGNVQISTPFKHFKATGLTVSHTGKLNDFRSSLDLTYMDNKNINGKISLSTDGLKRINLDSEFATTFEKIPSANLIFNHNYDKRANSLTGDLSLTTPIADFGVGSISYEKLGGFNNLMVQTQAKRNGQQIANVKLTNTFFKPELHSKLNVEVSEYPSLTVSFDHVGDLSSFNSKASADLGNNNVNGEVSKRGSLDDLTLGGSAGYNGDAVKISGTWNSQRGLDGKLDVKTPFENFNDIGMSISHSGDATDFTSTASVEYMDDKTISGKVELSVGDSSRFSSELSTPFQGFEFTKVEANGIIDTDVNAKVSLTSTVNEFGNGEVSFSKSGSMDNLVLDGNILRNNIELGNVRLTHRQIDNEVNSRFTSRGSMVPEIDANLGHTGNLQDFETKADVNVNNEKLIDAEVTFNKRSDSINANAKVNAEFMGQLASLRIEKDGKFDDIKVKLTGNHNGDEYVADGKLKLKSETTGSLSISTPIEGYKNVGLSLKDSKNQRKRNVEVKLNLVDGEDYSAKIDFYRDQYRLIETNVEINTPIENAELTKFEYRHEGQQDRFTCIASLEYGQSNKITYDMSAAVKPDLDLSVSITTPYDNYKDMMASATVENSWPKLSIISKVNAGNDRQSTLRGSLDASKGITGSLSLSTPIEGFSDIGLSFDHSGKLRNFKSEGRITYMDDKEISGKVVFKLRRSYFLAEVRTPFSGFEYTKGEIKKTSTNAESTTETYLVYNDGKVISTETTVAFKPKPGFSVNIKTPMPQFEELMASVSVDNSWPKLELNSKASAGSDRQVTFDASFDASDDISGSIQIGTPIDGFKNIGLNFKHSGDGQKFDSEGKVTYMDGQDIEGKVGFYKYLMRRLVATAELSTPFSGLEKTKAEINFEDNSNSISTTAALEYGNEQKLDGNLRLTYSPGYEALLTINTPFEKFSIIRAQGSLDITEPSYSATYNINYGDAVYSASGKLNLYSVKNVDGSIELRLPIQGIEFTKAEYQHTINDGHVDGSASLIYGDSQTVSAELKASSIPNFDATMIVKTPFDGYEMMKGSASYDGSYDKYDASSSLSLGRGQSFSVISGLDLSAEPYRASVQIATPYTNYRNMELVLTHEGALNNFHCTGFLSSPLTENINADASLKFTSVSDMEASASLKSSLVGMDDLLAEIKNSDVAGEKKTHVVVGWTSGQQVVLDGQIRQTESWYENKLYGDMSLSTPFIAVQNLAIQMEHSGKQKESAQKFGFELNGDKLLDMETEFSSKKKQEAVVTFRKPMAMKYSVAASKEAGLSEAEVLANWDMDKVDSNVRLLATVNDQSDSYKTDRSFDIGLEHASRKMGLVHQLTSSDSITASSGKIYWDSDDSSKVSYDLELKNNNRRRKEVKDGYLTLGLPFRTLKISGSCSDNKVVKKADAVFSWDADRQDSQVGIKGTITRGDRVKGDLTLSMPSIRKEIRVDGELMAQNGRVILDTKTDISYSQDSRKTLTLTSKLEDISSYYSHYNYSLAVGVKHPYTNVDIQMTSHLGSSDEKMTLGINTDYLTARKQTKNLGLLTEINKLKRQISLQITHPINKVEILGDVVSTSPYKVRMLNKVDDVEVFRSDITVDENKKSVELNMFEGSEGISLWAGYPNNTAFRGEITRINYGNELTEALLAVRLNSSRLMHTRLHWNPDLVQELQVAVRDRTLAGSVRASEVLADINVAVSEEIFGKYEDISSAISEELTPLIKELDKELTQVARAMTKLSKEMKKAYKNNDYYLQDMGDSFTQTYAKTQQKLATFTKKYRKASSKLVDSLKEGLQEMTSYPIREQYSQIVEGSSSWLSEKAYSILSLLEAYLVEANEAMAEYHNTISDIKLRATNSLYNATYVNYVSDSLANFDVSPYVPSMEIPEAYTNAIYNAHDAINTRLGDMMDAPGINYVKDGVNEVYQQGVWAYNYWEVEENIYNHVQNILELIQEIAKDELKEYMQDLQGIYQNPITVWDPEHGEVQADFKLPIDVARLDQIPDLSPLIDPVIAYLPDANTFNNISLYGTPVEAEDDITKELRRYNPTRAKRVYRTRKVFRQ